MHWSSDKNAGFRASPQALIAHHSSTGIVITKRVNVEAQS